MNPLQPHVFESLVAAGVQAPSADNLHNLSFEQTQQAIRVWSTVDVGSMAGHWRVLSYISYGAVVENMSLRADELGLRLTAAWFPDPSLPSLIAELTVASEVARPSDLAACILKRHTNRKFFRGPPLSGEEREAIQREAQGFEGVELLWLDAPGLRDSALRLARQAETERFRDEYFHRELFGSIRFELGWEQPSDEGLAPGSLEVERPMRAGFSALRFWPLMKLLTALGVHHTLGLRAGYFPCRLSPHLCALVTKLDLSGGALVGGRVFERLWLRASSLGLCLQPMAAAAVFSLPVSDRVRDALRERLAAGWARLAPGRQPLMLFRLGRAKPPTVINGRRAAVTYLRGTSK